MWSRGGQPGQEDGTAESVAPAAGHDLADGSSAATATMPAKWPPARVVSATILLPAKGEALPCFDVLDDGDKILSPAETQQFSERVTITADSTVNNDVTLTTADGTTITIAGINVDGGSGGPFDSYNTLSLHDLQSGPGAIVVEFNPDHLRCAEKLSEA